MILKSTTSKLSIVNLFADFILNKIPKDQESIIQIADCVNFFVIKGKTTHSEPLDIIKIKEEFITKFKEQLGETKLSHTIDLIEYNSKLKPLKSLSCSYHYGTDNCSYTTSQVSEYLKDDTKSYQHEIHVKSLDDISLINCSEFPHGHSLGQGRLMYYYGKHIFYNIPSSYPVNTLTFNLSTEKEEMGDPLFSVMKSKGEVDDVLTSAILDIFDFDMSWLKNEIKKVDWSIEITNPLQDYDFLKKKVKDFVIF